MFPTKGGNAMRDRFIEIFSSQNGAKICFRKKFESSFAPPKIGDIVALGMVGEPKGTLKQGVVVNVRKEDYSDWIRVGTEEATAVLRNCLVPDDWDEIPSGQSE